jgi:hypothetical protein
VAGAPRVTAAVTQDNQPIMGVGAIREIAAVLIAVAALAVAGCSADTPVNITLTNAPPQTGQTIPAPLPTVSMGQTAIDETVTFTDIDVLIEHRTSTPAEPEGVYVTVVMDVRNTGTVPQRYVAEDQRLLDGHGRVFSPDVPAMLRKGSPDPVTAIDVNPGNTAPAFLSFDVPDGMQASDYLLELHSAPHSRGVAIRLPPG